MHGLLKQSGYRLHPPDSLEARALLAEQALTRALAHLESTEGTAVRAIVGINEDGVFGGTRAGWRPNLSDALHEPFITLLWVELHELLGRVPVGSTARFANEGTLPAKRKAAPTFTGWPAEASTRSTDRHRFYAAVASRQRNIARRPPFTIPPRKDPDSKSLEHFWVRWTHNRNG
jgi:hypothetical protein